MKPRTEIRNYRVEMAGFRRRVMVAAGFVLVMFLLLLSRFFYVQVLQYQHYHTLAENNRISLVPSPPNRGLILDRNGVVLAHNYSAYTLEITPSKTGNLDATLDALAKIVEVTPGQRKRFAKLMAESRNFETLPLRAHLSDEEVARLAANRYRLPGVEVRARLFRQYPQQASASHLLGYIGRINDKDVERLQAAGVYDNYRGSDHIGKVGIEQSYERELHGVTGTEQVETDAGGHAGRVLARTPPISGNSLVLYLDSKLQAIAEQAFGHFRGALVAIDPRTGGVLAFVSQPGYDPNLFVDGIDTTSWNELNTSPDRPLLNRALRGAYPEGSTIKPFIALAGLSYGVRKPSDSISDPGYFMLPNSSHRYRDWKAGGHGTVDLHKAIVQSCDTYFYRLANDLGIDRMHAYLGQFGFGQKSGIDMDGESSGVLPSREWKASRSKLPWFPGETVIAGIGQGYNLATPLQLAVATAALANGGTVYKPQLVQAIIDSRTGKRTAIAPQIERQISISAADLEAVRAAMEDVTHPGGTASVANAGVSYRVAAKTGTAQVVGIKQGAKYDAKRMLEIHRDHAVYIAFAPAEAPTIAVAVLVENGSHGGTTAAPIARAVMDYYLLGKLPKAAIVPVAPAPAPGDAHAD